MPNPHRILAIDPSSTNFGYVILDTTGVALHKGVLQPKGLPHELLLQIHELIKQLCKDWEIDEVAMEKLGYNFAWDTGILKVVFTEVEKTVKQLDLPFYEYAVQTIYAFFKIDRKNKDKKKAVAEGVIAIWDGFDKVKRDITDAAAVGIVHWRKKYG